MLNNTMNHTMKDTAKKERTSMKGLFDEWEFESILDSISDAVFIDDSSGCGVDHRGSGGDHSGRGDHGNRGNGGHQGGSRPNRDSRGPRE